VAISQTLADHAPRELKRRLLQPVHNSVDPEQFPFVGEKSDYFITLARVHPDKGQAIAVRLCQKLGYKLRLAGVVGSLVKPRQVLMELADPLSRYRSMVDFRYFSDRIFPYLDDDIQYVGDISGQHKMDFLSHARALLFPIQWDEPFGMAPIEALACGTPVIAMARGALPEIIQHGINGFLAHNEGEFEHYMQRVGEIDPAACRRSVEEKFSARRMAKEYIQRYKTAIRRKAKRKV
jgi:glycosyltransferase involved in cell wall biosynthesis